MLPNAISESRFPFRARRRSGGSAAKFGAAMRCCCRIRSIRRASRRFCSHACSAGASLLPRLLMVLADRFIARPMLARADRVAIVSEITARHFSQVRFRSTPELIFNGLDTEVFHPVAQSRRLELRSALGLEPDRPIALFVGRFVEKKGLPILAHMARIRPDIQWAFAG